MTSAARHEAGTSAPPDPLAVSNADPFSALPTSAHNVAEELGRAAARRPDERAVTVARAKRGRIAYAGCTFAELDGRATAIARGLLDAGLEPGQRVSLFVTPGVELIALSFALFRAGAVPVLIDPGLGKERLLSCSLRIRPEAFIGIPRAQVARRLYRSSFPDVKLSVAVGRPRLPGDVALRTLERRGASSSAPLPSPDADGEAAILFTSGSTGPPKGVVYTHGNFQAQLEVLRRLYDLREGEVDMACFPLFALFDTALGVESVFPPMDASKPASCDPELLVRTLTERRATLSFGSPAIWRRVAPYATSNGLAFEHLRRILVAGAPVPPCLAAELSALLPNGDVHTPYGMTEALPVTSISGAEIAAERPMIERGRGTCVGRLAPGIEVSVLRLSASDARSWSPRLAVPPLADAERARAPEAERWGEVCVRGPVVTQAYAANEAATEASKLAHPGGGPLWHRSGDLGFVDGEGRLWFGGRVAHRLETAEGLVPPVPTENVANAHPGVRRSALVGVGPRGLERPVLIVERAEPNSTDEPPDEDTLARDLLRHLAESGHDVRPEHVLFRDALPVDVRHNAKIHREELKAWAEERLA